MKKKDLVVLRYRKIDDARTLTQQPTEPSRLAFRSLATCDLRACDFELEAASQKMSVSLSVSHS
jgi:hypothetical protein